MVIYLHLVDLDGVGKYIVRPMDPMGGGMCWVRPPLRIPVIARINQGVRMVPPPRPVVWVERWWWKF